MSRIRLPEALRGPAALALALAACGIQEAAPEGAVSLKQEARTCAPPDVEMANFCQKWDQLPGDRVQMDLGAGTPVEVNYKLIGISANRTAYTQGDIVIGDENTINQITNSGQTGPTEGVARISKAGRWPNGQVAYVIDQYLPNPQRINDAIAHWQARTALQFRVRTNETDYIRFQDGGGCSSWVGRVGGEQAVTLNAGCTTGNTIHEIGHAIGLWHEQSRTDRDDFVVIHYDNITSGYEHNFDVITDPLVQNGDIARYNFGSIMHYPTTAFAIDPTRPTIETQSGIVLAPTTVIGQRNGLSQGDVTAATLVYCQEPDYPCVIPVDPYL